jgi:hypothetical protein
MSDPERVWPLYAQIAKKAPARGNLMPAPLSTAILKIHRIRTLSSRDQGFARFAFLGVIDTLQQE